ncbi:Uncharacterised protein [Serratia proteamaculans]|uniref:hypothetical protein n=1 Tax=Serratia proteamaculans TaxID=28151 RepID=UPI00217A2E0B|nr:hypothetical protein [Serratia proteamaculans]CAI2019938.1 Uncharacterised protein [Serratia proteamaculans]
MAVGIPEWVPVITALAGIVGALGSQYLSHWFARQREKEVAVAKHESEQLFIATELIIVLEQFTEGCAMVAVDEGEPDERGIMRAKEKSPKLSLENVEGDWRVLPGRLMFRVRELPILLIEAKRFIDAVNEHDDPPDYDRSFAERQYQYTRLGLKALFLSIRLRKLTGLPETRLETTSWSVGSVLWQVWKTERKRRTQFLHHLLHEMTTVAEVLK